ISQGTPYIQKSSGVPSASQARLLHVAAQSSRDAWQLELKNCASWRVCRDAQTSIVSFDDLTSNCPTHTHPRIFGSIEGLENVLQYRWIHTRPRISDCNQ